MIFTNRKRDTSQGILAGRKVVANVAVLSAGEATNLIAMTIWTIVVARYIGPELYGVYTYLGATLGILVIFVNIGLDRLLTRDVAQQPDQGARYLTTFVLIKTLLSVVVLGGFLAWVSSQSHAGARTSMALLVTGIWFLGAIASLINAMLYAYEAMRGTVIAQALNSVLTLGAGLLAVWLHQPFSVVLGLSLAASSIQVLVAGGFALRYYPRQIRGVRELIFPVPQILSLLKKSLPFGGMVLMAALYTNMIVVLLEELTENNTSVGYFGAAMRIFSIALVIPGVLSRASLPVLSNTYTHSPDRFGSRFVRAYRYVFFVTVPAGIGLWLIGPYILALVYGPQYAGAATSLQILSLVLLGSAVYITGPALEAMDRQMWSVLIYVVALVAVALVAYWAIPRYGIEGAAWALVVGAGIRLGVESALVFTLLKLRYPIAWTVKTTVASIVMGYIGFLALKSCHFIIVMLLVAPLVYLLAQVALRTLSKSDWEYVQKFMPNCTAGLWRMIARLQRAT